MNSSILPLIESVPTRHKLKIALLVGDLDILAWQHALLSEIAESEHSFVGVWIKVVDERSQRLDQKLAFSLFDKFRQHDNKPPVVQDACDIMNASELLGGVACITLPSESAGGVQGDLTAAVEELRTHRVDVILAIRDISSINLLVDASKYGVWFYDHSRRESNRADSSWVGFWEVLGRQPYMHSELIVRSQSVRGDRTVYKSFSGVDPRSFTITRSEHLWKIRAFVPRMLRELWKRGGEDFLQNMRSEVNVEIKDASQPLKKLNSSNVMASLAKYAAWRLMLKITRKFFSEKWILMFKLGGDSEYLDKYTKIHPPKDWFWADPYVIKEDEHYFIFFEEASVKSGHGHIAAIRMDDNGNYGQSKRVLERPYHLSYPFIFEWQQNRYMTVESAENRTIEVYRCIEFPYEWQFECTLMENVEAYDATLFEHGNTWWLFANVREHEGASTWDELCIYSSDNPLSNGWRPHPMNPVISDVRRARPAGRIFEKDGHIYRPSQNSSHRYGYGFNFNEILELTRTTYSERLVECFEPNWDRSIRALHTFSAAGELAVIDAIYRTGQFGGQDV